MNFNEAILVCGNKQNIAISWMSVISAVFTTASG